MSRALADVPAPWPQCRKRAFPVHAQVAEAIAECAARPASRPVLAAHAPSAAAAGTSSPAEAAEHCQAEVGGVDPAPPAFATAAQSNVVFNPGGVSWGDTPAYDLHVRACAAAAAAYPSSTSSSSGRSLCQEGWITVHGCLQHASCCSSY